jgi:hypothetical protein
LSRCFEGTPGRLTVGHAIGEQIPEGYFGERGEELENVWIRLKLLFYPTGVFFFKYVYLKGFRYPRMAPTFGNL